MFKKVTIFLLTILLCLCLLGCSSESNGDLIYTGRYGKLISLTASEVQEMMDDNQTFVLYAGQGDCSSCEEFTESVKKIVNTYEIDIYYLNAGDYETNEELQQLVYNYLYRLEWTPTVYYIEEGKATNMVEDPMEYSEFVDWLVEHGFLL